MISLSALDRLAASDDSWGTGTTLDPATVKALVRVARAARACTSYQKWEANIKELRAACREIET